MRKIVFREYAYRECDSFGGYLQEMAEKGWYFKGWKLGMIFEKGEPGKFDYRVEVFTEGEEEDNRPTPEAEEFAQYCQAAGWEFIDARRKFCVFRKAAPDAVSIVTEEERFQNVKKAELLHWARWWLSSIFIGGVYLWEMFFLVFSSSVISNRNIVLAVLWFLSLTAGWLSLAVKIIWYFQTKRKLGQEPVFYGYKGSLSRVIPVLRGCCSSWQILLLCVILLLMMGDKTGLVLGAALVLILIFRGAIKAGRVSRYGAFMGSIIMVVVLIPIIFVGVYLINEQEETDENPENSIVQWMTFEEGKIGIERTDESASFLCRGDSLEVYLAEEKGEEIEFSCQVYQSPHSWILERIMKQEGKGLESSEIQESWKAKAGLEEKNRGSYALLYEDSLVLLNRMVPDDARDDGQWNRPLGAEEIQGLQDALGVFWQEI